MNPPIVSSSQIIRRCIEGFYTIKGSREVSKIVDIISEEEIYKRVGTCYDDSDLEGKTEYDSFEDEYKRFRSSLPYVFEGGIENG